MSTRTLLVFVSFVFIICTESCDGIGSWRKKKTASETVNTDPTSNNSIENNSNMEKTYLDLFGESAKEFLTQKGPEKIKIIFQASDEDCRWDWRYFRCEPYCECSFQPKFPGDFHLGRACRKRSNFGRRGVEDQSRNEESETSFEETDQTYREYCVMETSNESSDSGDFVGQQQKPSTPPPPSIPSPFPFLAKGGKATWRVIRTKADPVVAKAVDEFETMHGRVQAVVCQDLQTRCDDSETLQNNLGNNGTSSSAPIEVAWQERLFCREAVRECRASTSRQKEKRNDRNPEE